jgi:hypothetical protein
MLRCVLLPLTCRMRVLVPPLTVILFAPGR